MTIQKLANIFYNLRRQNSALLNSLDTLVYVLRWIFVTPVVMYSADGEWDEIIKTGGIEFCYLYVLIVQFSCSSFFELAFYLPLNLREQHRAVPTSGSLNWHEVKPKDFSSLISDRNATITIHLLRKKFTERVMMQKILQGILTICSEGRCCIDIGPFRVLHWCDKIDEMML